MMILQSMVMVSLVGDDGSLVGGIGFRANNSLDGNSLSGEVDSLDDEVDSLDGDFGFPRW